MAVILVSEALLMSGEDFGPSVGQFYKAAQGLMDDTVFVDFLGG